MSKKIYIGLIAGTLIGISITVILKFKKEESLFSEEDLSDGNDMLQRANRHLLSAKKKAEKLVEEAREKSDSILKHAAEILLLAKEKTSLVHYDKKGTAEKELNKIKTELEDSIRKYKSETGF